MTNRIEDALRALESKMRKFSARGDTNEQWADELAAILRQPEAAPERPKSCPHSTSPLRYCCPCPVSPCPMEVEAAPSPPDSSQGEPTCYVAEESLKRLRDGTYNFVSAYREKNVLFGVPLYTHPSSPQVAKWYDEQNSNVEEVSGMGAGSSDYQCAQVAVADGYAIVPVEPTPEMMEAAKPALGQVNDVLALHQARGHALELRVDGKYPLWHAYKAMIAAAPQSAPKAADDTKARECEPQARHWRLALLEWAGREDGMVHPLKFTDLMEQRARSLAHAEQAAKGRP